MVSGTNQHPSFPHSLYTAQTQPGILCRNSTSCRARPAARLCVWGPLVRAGEEEGAQKQLCCCHCTSLSAPGPAGDPLDTPHAFPPLLLPYQPWPLKSPSLTSKNQLIYPSRCDSNDRQNFEIFCSSNRLNCLTIWKHLWAPSRLPTLGV